MSPPRARHVHFQKQFALSKYSRDACSDSVFVQVCLFMNSRSSLVMLLSGRDIVRDRLTACAHDAYCKTFFPWDSLALHARDTACTEARVISTELQYHFSHGTLGSMPACGNPCLYCTPHSPVVSLAMQIVIHDECLDSECPTP